MIINNTEKLPKKIQIEVKRKYAYINIDNKGTIKCEKERLSLDFTINFSCMCDNPLISRKRFGHRCAKCGHIINDMTGVNYID